MNKQKWLSGVVLLLAGLLVNTSVMASVLTSVRPVGFIASALTDGITTTEILLPDGASPHEYALRPSDMKRINGAELVVWVGPDMEAFLSKPLQSVDNKLTLSLLPSIAEQLRKGEEEHEEEHSHEHTNHSHSEYDLHIWMSPQIAKTIAVELHKKLLELMPQNKDKLDANLHYFEQQLKNTEQKIVNMLAPVHNNGYFVFHDAYGYFERSFGLKQLGHFTINPEIQPGAQRVHEIRTQVLQQKAVCLFAEPQFRAAIIDTVAKGTDVRIGILDPLGSKIVLGKDSYSQFLLMLSESFVDCLRGN